MVRDIPSRRELDGSDHCWWFVELFGIVLGVTDLCPGTVLLPEWMSAVLVWECIGSVHIRQCDVDDR